MIFPLESMVEFKEGMYEITVAASRRAYQLAMTKDPLLEENDGKVVSLAAKQLFSGDVHYSIEESKR
ncbi:DNA-directed RNA polymerase subunit omega [Treponema rectale]|uniref:DNA-directed RNA polymerase subunit omega n=1 Tax=Treponema rectale TaxID=744512 RepID=A0A840SGB9_9SPIR|nr:DNA-directed RNA polymerase subunit omega [Treponema rectale]MBB5218472.1 DNA-directed RNA polymerase subunit omega [Treponema rectale]QOS39840.1 DNA-directed RNA polymerase subunit omega [Treponema rectale]